MNDIQSFQGKIGYNFKDFNLLKKAFIHRSYINENKNLGLEHNEKLEFLGDAVLELSATNFLYHKFLQKTEGELTAIRSALVSTDSLALHGDKLNMGNYLLLSKGEKDSLNGRKHILANTFEAVVGAIYLDGGFEPVDNFLRSFLFDYVDKIVLQKLYKDPKSYFQEQAQEKKKITPHYELISEKGKDHNKAFVMGLFLEKELITKGIGGSKQKAEINAAKNALEKMKWI